MQTNSPLFEALTGEMHHRSMAALLAVVALLIHLYIVMLLLQPTGPEHQEKPLKIMEVALIPIPEPKPIAEAPPPAPPKVVLPPKKVTQPKKKEIKPPVKQKEQIVHKQGEILKPNTVTKEAKPELLAPSVPAQKIEQPTSAPQSPIAIKPVAKPGNGDPNSKGRSSGVVEIGCPKPKYPPRAMSRHISGWVRVEMVINPSGAVSSAKIIDAQPSGIFDEAALNAMRQCKFKPKIVNGVAVAQTATKKSTFNLSN